MLFTVVAQMRVHPKKVNCKQNVNSDVFLISTALGFQKPGLRLQIRGFGTGYSKTNVNVSNHCKDFSARLKVSSKG